MTDVEITLVAALTYMGQNKPDRPEPEGRTPESYAADLRAWQETIDKRRKIIHEGHKALDQAGVVPGAVRPNGDWWC